MNKKIVITGALGHIGSSVLRNLPSSAEEVLLIDNLESQRFCSLFDLPEGAHFKFLEADVRTCDLEAALSGADTLIHLAAITNAEASKGREAEVESVNFQGLQRVAEVCLKHRVKLLFPSTTSVYGSQEVKVDETCAELKPQSPYADSKLKAENYLLSLKDKGLRFVICRFGTIFGYSIGMRFHTAVNKFTWQAVNRQPVTVWRTAWEQRRPYLHLGDCVQSIAFILEKDLFNGEIYNILTGNYTVKEVVEAITKQAPDLRVEFVDSAIMNQLSYDVDDSKFRALGFAPQGNLADGIAETTNKLKRIY